MIKTSLIVASAIFLSAAVSPTMAQWSGTSGTYSALAEPGDPTPEFNVGELHLQVEGWDMIPIYSIVDNPDAAEGESPWKVCVRGIFIATDPIVTKGDEQRAVWYERPSDPLREQWTASTWSVGSISVAEAAYSVKLRLHIPDIQDQLWAINDIEFIKADELVPFACRIIAGDPKAVPIDAPEEGELSHVETYPFAGVPIEAGDIEKVHANLEHLAETFETVITTRSWDTLERRAIWPHHPQQGLILNRSGQ